MFDIIIEHLNNPTLIYILIGVVLSTISTAIIGSFWFLQKKALIGDVIAHALLPGICLGFLCTSTKMALYLTIGAFITGSLALFLLEQVNVYSKIKKDSAMALIISTFLGIGLFLLTYIQQSGNESQAGLKSFLFGQASTLVTEDIFVFMGLACILISITILFFKAFSTIGFDPIFAQTIGWPVGLLNLLIQSLTILTIVTGMQSIGILLIASILTIPAATARFWTNHLPFIVVFAALFATLSSILGTMLSYLIAGLPTGPCIVLCLIGLALLSFLIAPKKGFLSRRYKQYKYQEKILIENVLKLVYELGKEDGLYYRDRKFDMLLAKRPMLIKDLKKAFKKLLAKGWVVKTGNNLWRLTPSGKAKGEHVLNLHTLWEAYLMRYLKIKPDHAHDDAESIEHLLTPEIEVDLRRLLHDAI